MRFIIQCVIALVLFSAPSVLSAQDPEQTVWDSILTPHGYCRLWGGIPGGSNWADQGLSVCSLQRRPVPLDGNPFPELGPVSIGVRGSLTVMINRDGTVDPRFTRYWSIGWSGPRSRQLTDSARLVLTRWRFTSGVRNDTTVRVALHVELAASAAPDTQPATLAWKYVQGFETDSLVGTWRLLPPLPPFDEKTALRAEATALRAIVGKEAGELSSDFCVYGSGNRRRPVAEVLERAKGAGGRPLLECTRANRSGIHVNIGGMWRPAPNMATVEISVVNDRRRRGLLYRCLVRTDTETLECRGPALSSWVY